MRFRRAAAGGWAALSGDVEDRSVLGVFPGGKLDPAPSLPSLLPPYSREAPVDVTTGNATRVADAYACVRVLADSISSLPLHVYRRTEAGRVAAGESSRAVQLLSRPSPGSTGVDLISTAMVHLAITGDCFIGKYRAADGEIAQLGCIPPDSVEVDLRGQKIVYTLDTIHGRTEHGPEDVLHVKAMSLDGLRGMCPIKECRTALGLASAMAESARQYFAQGSRPSGILSSPSAFGDSFEALVKDWRYNHTGAANFHRVAVMGGDIKFTPIAFNADENQFLQQRELSTREIARIFRVPAWAIEGSSGDSLTYANVTEQNRALVMHSLRPWIVRLERAISNDPDLCAGGTYVAFDLDGLLRAAPEGRAQQYTAALDPVTGWMTRAETRELEDLPPEETP